MKLFFIPAAKGIFLMYSCAFYCEQYILQKKILLIGISQNDFILYMEMQYEFKYFCIVPQKKFFLYLKKLSLNNENMRKNILL